MKKISSISQIDWLLKGTMVYIYINGIIIYTHGYDSPTPKLDCRVYNANYPDDDFRNKSFGSHYEAPEWYQQHMAYWLEQSAKPLTER